MPGNDHDKDSDEAAMQRFVAGDVLAFDHLYALHSLSVWRYLMRHVRDASLADDLLQDVWFAVARQGTGYRPTAKFKTWLFTIAHNRMVDHWRGSRQHVSFDGVAGSGDGEDAPALRDTLAADSGFGPLRQLLSREQGEALLAAVEQLPVEQREAFLLQAEAGMSIEAIALTTGVVFETAKSRLRYARHALRQLLKEFA